MSAEKLQDFISLQPDSTVGKERAALVRAALAPVYGEPRLSAAQVSQYVLGQRLEVLARRPDGWCRVRGEDCYVGWVHRGYLLPGSIDWARRWETAEDGESVVSLGASLLDDEDRVVARLPWGARAVRQTARRLLLPGTEGFLAPAGEVVALNRLPDRFPPRGESVIRTARLWLGSPYLWGGVSPAGVDCSGFAQSVFWMHGVGLPRDSGMQVEVGEELGRKDPGEFRAGDLLFFAENRDQVSHVAIAMGEGRIIHASLSNGGVAMNDLAGGGELEHRLRRELVSARRVLPD